MILSIPDIRYPTLYLANMITGPSTINKQKELRSFSLVKHLTFLTVFSLDIRPILAHLIVIPSIPTRTHPIRNNNNSLFLNVLQITVRNPCICIYVLGSLYNAVYRYILQIYRFYH